MKAKDLIAALQNVSPDCDVSVWVNGNRHWAVGTDDSFVESENFFEININIGD
jgi:photosystem II stability/assembly factor-like uncharacterized protein